MERKHHITMHWGILLIVYFAILFATAMVELTSGSTNGYFLLLLAAGVPIYLIASRSVMGEHAIRAEPVPSVTIALDTNVVAFPKNSVQGIDLANAAAEARGHQLRKLG